MSKFQHEVRVQFYTDGENDQVIVCADEQRLRRAQRMHIQTCIEKLSQLVRQSLFRILPRLNLSPSGQESS